MSVLVGERGSGDKCTVASSSEGGEGEGRMMMLRAWRARERVFCSSRREAVARARLFSMAARAADRVWILVIRVGKALLDGSRPCPRVLASRAWLVLSRARRAREDR